MDGKQENEIILNDGYSAQLKKTINTSDEIDIIYSFSYVEDNTDFGNTNKELKKRYYDSQTDSIIFKPDVKTENLIFKIKNQYGSAKIVEIINK